MCSLPSASTSKRLERKTSPMIPPCCTRMSPRPSWSTRTPGHVSKGRTEIACGCGPRGPRLPDRPRTRTDCDGEGKRGDVDGDAAGGNHAVTSPPARDNLGPVAACKINLLPLDKGYVRPCSYIIHHRKVCMTHNLIVSDPDVMTGKPVVRGTCITVEMVRAVAEPDLA